MLNKESEYYLSKEDCQRLLQKASINYLAGEIDEQTLDEVEKKLEVDYEKTWYRLTPIASEIATAFKEWFSFLI